MPALTGSVCDRAAQTLRAVRQGNRKRGRRRTQSRRKRMRSRPTLTDRVMYVIARHHAERVYAPVHGRHATGRFRPGDRCLRPTSAETPTAISAGTTISTGSGPSTDFRRQLPILRYEDHRPYIERVRNGQIQAMFGGRQRVHMFALTSGTTDQPKYIPVTDEFPELVPPRLERLRHQGPAGPSRRVSSRHRAGHLADGRVADARRASPAGRSPA